MLETSEVLTLIIGKVSLSGVPPAPKSIPCETHPTTRFFITDTNNGLADTLVYISKGLSSPSTHRIQSTNEVVFTNCQIEPFVSAVFRDTKIRFRDALGSHHYLRFSSADGRVTAASVAPGQSAVVRLQRNEIFTSVVCQDHPYEVAYVSALDHGFFALSGSDGGFALTNVPPGNYTLTAVHRRPGATRMLSQQVQVRPGEAVPVDFTFEESAAEQLSSR